MKRITRITTTGLAVGLLLAAAATAQPPQSFGGPGGAERGQRGPGHDSQRLIEFLELDETQAEQWRAAHERNREQTQPLFEEMRRLHQELRDTLDSEAADPTTVGQLVLEQHAVRQQLEAQREALQAELVQILDEEQLARWEAFQEARRERRPHRGLRGPGPGGGDAGGGFFGG